MRGGYGISFTPEGFGWSFPWWAGFNQTNSVPADSKGMFLPVFNIDNGYSGQTVRAESRSLVCGDSSAAHVATARITPRPATCRTSTLASRVRSATI